MILKKVQRISPQRTMTTTNNNSSSSFSKGGKSIFVTVGTTQFDKLVEAVTSKVVLEWMKRQGFSSLTIQYGRGIKPETNYDESSSSSSSSSPHPFRIEAYDFRPSLIDDMEKADLILSHAGAGTVMEVLRMTNSNNNNGKDDKDSISKKLIVVINTILMDNHQLELATAMADRGHLFVVHQPEQLQQTETWTAFEDFVPTCLSHQIGDSYDFPILLDSFLGFPPDNINKIKKSE